MFLLCERCDVFENRIVKIHSFYLGVEAQLTMETALHKIYSLNLSSIFHVESVNIYFAPSGGESFKRGAQLRDLSSVQIALVF